MIASMKFKAAGSLTLLASAGMASASLFSPLAPGGTTPVPNDIFESALPYGNPIDSKVSNFSATFGTDSLSGSLTTLVYRDVSTGDIEFGYFFTLDSSSTDSVTGLAVGNFKGYTTDVAAGDPTTFPYPTYIPPTDAQRSGSGTTVTFEYPEAPGLGSIAPGQTSRIAYILTDGKNYTDASAGVLDGISANADTFGLTPVPEPASLIALATGAAALLRRRKRA